MPEELQTPKLIASFSWIWRHPVLTGFAVIVPIAYAAFSALKDTFDFYFWAQTNWDWIVNLSNSQYFDWVVVASLFLLIFLLIGRAAKKDQLEAQKIITRNKVHAAERLQIESMANARFDNLTVRLAKIGELWTLDRRLADLREQRMAQDRAGKKIVQNLLDRAMAPDTRDIAGALTMEMGDYKFFSEKALDLVEECLKELDPGWSREVKVDDFPPPETDLKQIEKCGRWRDVYIQHQAYVRKLIFDLDKAIELTHRKCVETKRDAEALFEG